jgi:riboflavin synthase alpha subunit
MPATMASWSERARAGSIMARRKVSGIVNSNAAAIHCGTVPAAKFLAEKGSICIDGVSLTVSGLGRSDGADWFEVAIIPHTLKVTTLGALTPGDRVNLEVDMLARYVARMLEWRDK